MILSKDGYQKKVERIAELRALLVDCIKNKGPIEHNDSLVDCNASVISRKDQMVYYLNMLKQEEKELKEATVIEDLELPEDIIQCGDTVTVFEQFGNEEPEEVTYRLVDIVDDDLDSVSLGSPIGRALLGKRVGETVECTAPAGNITMSIVGKNLGIKRG